MANADHMAQFMKGVTAWNAWRRENNTVRPDLSEENLSDANYAWGKLLADLVGPDLRQAKANLSERLAPLAGLRREDLVQTDLRGANFSEARLCEVNLTGANLFEANLSAADLTEARLYGTNLKDANLSGANLFRAKLHDSSLIGANLTGANLSEAELISASLFFANLTGANLFQANLKAANLTRANLSGANLSEARLHGASLLNADLRGADLTGCHIYGVSAWRVKLDGDTKQQNLIITGLDEPKVMLDNIEVAQFVYLLLHNEKIRDVIDTVGKKGVLLLGRFTESRIEILERLRAKLRELGFVPIVFNFDKPETKDFTETVRLLANLSHFVIVDITNPRSAPLELQALVPDYMVPFVPILEKGQSPFPCS
jgi:uncharacterized protein YjbI with pentapeptide repeats